MREGSRLIEREAFRSFRSSRNRMSGGSRAYPECTQNHGSLVDGELLERLFFGHNGLAWCPS